MSEIYEVYPQKELSKVLGLSRGIHHSSINATASWSEIFVEIGKLQEKAEQLQAIKAKEYFPTTQQYTTSAEPINVCGGANITSDQ